MNCDNCKGRISGLRDKAVSSQTQQLLVSTGVSPLVNVFLGVQSRSCYDGNNCVPPRPLYISGNLPDHVTTIEPVTRSTRTGIRNPDIKVRTICSGQGTISCACGFQLAFETRMSRDPCRPLISIPRKCIIHRLSPVCMILLLIYPAAPSQLCFHNNLRHRQRNKLTLSLSNQHCSDGSRSETTSFPISCAKTQHVTARHVELAPPVTS